MSGISLLSERQNSSSLRSGTNRAHFSSEIRQLERGDPAPQSPKPGDRDRIVVWRNSGLSYGQIARQLGCSRSAVAGHLWREARGAKTLAEAAEGGYGRAKLTRTQALEIRDSLESPKLLAERYGVAVNTIYHVRSGANWANRAAV